MAKPVVRTTTGATVKLTVELSSLGCWGPDCQIDQVYRQALREAEGKLRRLFEGQNIRIIGSAQVQAITTDVEVKRGN
ncbi:MULTISPECIES: hypothetical protein [unclassified Serratia (in: enterobacteria)]|uniref:hypothetical protein n=1 Tax=unclassified Serratia (in: enterobacteria) TaxID=2647522 RepID=UPI0004FFD77F|nr:MULTISPECIES: hypothetical protein [unclassified Serratia (in: enterobacteria)]KFK93583.1 hypothetical protein JV45_15705 [Serratia sp. Ag2]KFK93852.1 hypothetical protein IV04_23430 [Serratia sp. Ag1]